MVVVRFRLQIKIPSLIPLKTRAIGVHTSRAALTRNHHVPHYKGAPLACPRLCPLLTHSRHSMPRCPRFPPQSLWHSSHTSLPSYFPPRLAWHSISPRMSIHTDSDTHNQSIYRLPKNTIPARETAVASIASILAGFGVVALFCSVGVYV